MDMLGWVVPSDLEVVLVTATMLVVENSDQSTQAWADALGHTHVFTARGESE